MASAIILLSGLAYTIGEVVVAFLFKTLFVIISAFIRRSSDPTENDIVIPPFDTTILAGSVGLALIVFCLPRMWCAWVQRKADSSDDGPHEFSGLAASRRHGDRSDRRAHR